ncbi:egsA, partial [Symbiodinium sp. CCMP2456]
MLMPENSIPAFEIAWGLGAAPEADLRTTRDGVIVAFHDNNLRRVLSDGDEAVRNQGIGDLTYLEVAALDVGRWRGEQYRGQRVPRMTDVYKILERHPDRLMYLDIKQVDFTQLASESKAVHRQLIVASTKYHELLQWKALAPDSPTLHWMGGSEDELRARFDKLEDEHFDCVDQLQIHVRFNAEGRMSPSEEFLRGVGEQLRRHGVLFQVFPWETKDPRYFERLLDLGVVSFATDYPDVTAETAARDTKQLLVGRGVLRDAGALFASSFPSHSAILVADDSTYSVAGRALEESLSAAGVRLHDPAVLPAEELYAESHFVDRALAAIAATDAIPVALGAGTINDVVKLAAHRAGRRYLCVATAASMDGYTAYGSSITHEGSKQTFDCPAPFAVVADIDIIAAAPAWLNASGYADLFAKCPAGADWLLADGLGVEAIDAPTWAMVQDRLCDWLADPEGVRRGEVEPIQRLTVALMMTGFAMQASLSSRPASGAEHQFSHLWDMENHTHDGSAPSHGFKVGIGSLASLRLYEAILDRPLDQIDVESAVNQWPEWSQDE